jgi:hypothetical protein
MILFSFRDTDEPILLLTESRRKHEQKMLGNSGGAHNTGHQSRMERILRIHATSMSMAMDGLPPAAI